MTIDTVIEGFHFLRPWWLLLLPLLVLLLWYLRRMRLQSRSWQSVCDATLLPHLLITEGGTKARRSKLLVVALAGLLSILALAGPAWQQLEQPVFRDQSALVVILDLSRSMDATDVRPTRLTRARLKLIDILKQRKEGQAGLIVYAAEPFVVSPLTEDAETIIAQVGTLTSEMMPSQGSRPDLAITLAQQLLVQAGAQQGELLLITDGVENVPQDSLRESVTEMVQAGYRLSVLGVGDAGGAPVALASGGFLKDRNGEIVIPRLDEAALRDLAQAGEGRYQAMRVDDRDIATLLQGAMFDSEAVLEASQGFKADQWREEGPWLLLLLLPLVLPAFRRGYLLLIALLFLPSLTFFPTNLQAAEAEQSWWSELWLNADQRAAQTFDADNPAQAAQQFENSSWKAAAHYRAGEYQQSIAALEGVDGADALYNKGNAHAQLGQWQQALEAYEQALKQQPAHQDAQYNRDLVKQQLQQDKQQSGESQPEAPRSDDNQSGDQGEQSQQRDAPSNAAQSDQSQQGPPQSEPDSDASGSESSSDQAGETSDGQSSEQASSSAAQRDGEEREASQLEAARNRDEADEAHDQVQQHTGDDATQTEGDGAQEQGQSAISAAQLSEQQAEIQQANDQWLRRIPDDPGGLLRRKFQHQSQRARNRSGGQPRVEDESW